MSQLPAGADPRQGGKADERNRLNLTLSQELDTTLDHVARILGIPKTALATQALVQSLPGWLEQARTIRQSSRELGGGGAPGGQPQGGKHRR